MKKKFRFTLDIAVELKELKELTETEELSREKKENERLTTVLFKEFIKDDQAVSDFFKLWIIENFRFDYQYQALTEHLRPRDEVAIIKSVLKKTPPDVQNYFNDILDSQDPDRLEDLENFYQQLEHVEFAQAGFMEIK